MLAHALGWFNLRGMRALYGFDPAFSEVISSETCRRRLHLEEETPLRKMRDASVGIQFLNLLSLSSFSGLSFPFLGFFPTSLQRCCRDSLVKSESGTPALYSHLSKNT